MDETISATRSFYPNEEISASSEEFNRKRKKLQSELDDLPSPKHKFRDRSSNSDHASPTAQNPNAQQGVAEESGEDSNSFIEEDEEPTKTYSGCSDSIFKSALYSLESRLVKGKERDVADFDTLVRGEDDVAEEDQDHEFGGYLISGYEHACAELSDAEAGNVMLYSNAVTPNEFVLSSGRWSIGQGAQTSERKPTIDQEFEQYFSTLML